MSKEPTREHLLDVMAAELHVEREKLTCSARFGEDLEVDSLLAAEMMMKLEDEFEIEIPSDVERFRTVGCVLDFVTEAVASTPENSKAPPCEANANA